MKTLRLIILLYLVLLPLSAFAASSGNTGTPYKHFRACAYPTDPTCNQDGDRDGTLETAPPAVACSSVTGGYAGHFKDGALVRYQTEADATSASGTVVTKTDPWVFGEIAVRCNMTAGDYYFTVALRNGVGPQRICRKVGSSHGTRPITANCSAVALINSFTPTKIGTCTNCDTTENPVNSVVHAATTHPGGDNAIFWTSDGNMVLDWWYASTDPDAVPIPPTGGGGGTTPPHYVINTTASCGTPTAGSIGCFTNAPQIPLTGFNSTGGTFAASVKLVWDTATTDLFGLVQVTDTDVQVGTANANDLTTWPGNSAVRGDSIDFRYRCRPPDLNQTFDGNMCMVSVGANGFYFDADWSGTDNARDPTVNLTTTLTPTIGGGGYTIFFKVALPGTITAGDIGLFNFAITDRNAGGVTVKIACGFDSNAMSNADQFCPMLWSSDPVPGGGGDTTNPGTPTLTFTTITSSSIGVSATVSDSGGSTCCTATAKWSTTTGSYDSYSGGPVTLTVVGAAATGAITGLPSGTSQKVRVRVCDGTGVNCTDSAEGTQATTSSSYTHHAAPTVQGNGNCLSEGNAGLPMVCMGLAGFQAGSTLGLADGTYSCSQCMLQPPSGKNGTAANRITVKAKNDGAVRINGGGTKRPLHLNNNSWWVFEGFDVHDSNLDVVLISDNADNNIFRRIVAWNAKDNDNRMVWSIASNTGNVLEDVAGFGTGRKIFQWHGSLSNATLTIRRAWGRWERSTEIGPKMVFSIVYNSHNAIYENVIGTWDEAPMAGVAVNQPYGILSMDSILAGTDFCANTKYLGSIAYIRAADEATSMAGLLRSSNDTECHLFQDVVAYVQPGTHTGLRGASLLNDPLPSQDKFLRNATFVGIGTANSIQSTWAQSNVVSYASQALMATANASPWQTTSGTGARVCFRYVNGVLTSTPLWPWPMNQRIIDAMKTAGKTPVDVTQTMSAIFGTIPAACTA